VKHPSIQSLALYSGGELPFWTKWTMQRHVRGCAQCQHEVALFRESTESVLAETDEMPAGVQWERLAGEMRANIRLGIEASDAISAYGPIVESGPSQGMSWRMAALATGFVLLLSIGYWLNAAKKSEHLAAMRGPEPVIVEASEQGVGMSDGTKGLVLQGPKTNHRAAFVTVSTVGSAGVQYVDEETGQITVNHVYVE